MIKRMPEHKFWRQTTIGLVVTSISYLLGGAHLLAIVSSTLYCLVALFMLGTFVLYTWHQRTLPIEKQVPYAIAYLAGHSFAARPVV